MGSAIVSEQAGYSPPGFLQTIIGKKLFDLGISQDQRFSGVLAPSSMVGGEIGVTRQFLEDAQTYHEKYFNVAHSRWLMGGLLDRVNIGPEARLILDIGSGSGPSVFALLEHFPVAHVIATDVSPQLLAILRMALRERGLEQRCSTLCLDLNQQWFNGEIFDFALGGAILHHLFNPNVLVQQVFRTLKPGAVLGFFEPFEPGYAMMAMIYRLLIAQAESRGGVSDRVIDFFRGKVRHIGQMKCEPKDPLEYASVDDKWMFTKSYFGDLGKAIAAKETIIYSLNSHSNQLAGQMKTALRIGLGVSENALPSWAWETISDVEASISERASQDLLLEGCVAFVK